MRIDLITALPELVEAPLAASILGRARRANLVEINVVDLRQYSDDPHRKVDDYAFGGGAGMVLKPEPIFKCIESLHAEGPQIDDVVFLTPDAPVFNQQSANQLSMVGRLVLLAGHYKGVDNRVREHLVTRELSIGDYVLTGGELPALVVIDAVVRLIPGAIGDAASALSDSFQDDLLGAPVYTRPADFRGWKVPEVLRSGDHKAIEEWRETARVERTRALRPDLYSPDDSHSH